jgi:O-methyltransferase
MSTEGRHQDLLERIHAELTDPYEFADFFNRVLETSLARFHVGRFWGDRLLSLDKSAGFLDAPAFAKALEAIRGSHVYDQYQGPQSIAWRLHTLVWAAGIGMALDGDFVECGVFKGDMAWVVSQTTRIAASGKTFYLYDSFEGFSPDYSSPEDYPLNPGFLSFADGVYKEPGLYDYVSGRFADQAWVRVIKGFLPESLDQAAPERIAFLHVDLNSPKAEVAVLERLFDRVVPGGAVVFDDYGWKLFHRQKEAEDAFFAQRGYEILELPTGQGLVIKR